MLKHKRYWGGEMGHSTQGLQCRQSCRSRSRGAVWTASYKLWVCLLFLSLVSDITLVYYVNVAKAKLRGSFLHSQVFIAQFQQVLWHLQSLHFISQAISKDFTKINVRLVPLNIFGTSKNTAKTQVSSEVQYNDKKRMLLFSQMKLRQSQVHKSMARQNDRTRSVRLISNQHYFSSNQTKSDYFKQTFPLFQYTALNNAK